MSSKISALPPVTTPAPADLLPLVQAGSNYKMTLDQLRQALGDPLRFGQTVSQAGTNDPVVGNTLCNTMGGGVGVVWSRLDQGVFSAEFSGISFADADKLVVRTSAQRSPAGFPPAIAPVIIQYRLTSSSTVEIIVVDPTNYSGADEALNHYIEFQYYDV